MTESKKLTAKESAFVAEYLVDLNATQAAIRAGYSEKSAAVIGHENLRKPHIAEAIQEAMDKRGERVKISQDWILKKLRRIVKDCTGETLNPAGANKALELLMRHKGMLNDKLKVEADVTHRHENRLEHLE